MAEQPPGSLPTPATGTRWNASSPTPLTGAELRPFPYLQTHLTFREIGERLFVTRNTVATEVASIYRKLGVPSRTDAVHHATRSASSATDHVPARSQPLLAQPIHPIRMTCPRRPSARLGSGAAGARPTAEVRGYGGVEENEEDAMRTPLQTTSTVAVTLGRRNQGRG